MGWFFLLALLGVGISRLPAIMNWVKTVHCPVCGKWFCLEYHNFIVTDRAIAHNFQQRDGGYRNGLRGGGSLEDPAPMMTHISVNGARRGIFVRLVVVTFRF
jgi:hypothetical protein